MAFWKIYKIISDYKTYIFILLRNNFHLKTIMKIIKQIIFTLSLFLIFSCKKENKTVEFSDTKIDKTTEENSSDEKENLQALLRKLYQWHETQSSNNDFNVNSKDSIYISLNIKDHKKRIEELEKTGFFSTNFLKNYEKIGLKINNGLKSGELEWAVGELPPFGNDANPWCNCQDNPENYWKTLTIQKIKIDGNVADLTWTWGSDFEYKVIAVKAKNSWKIDYLEGFDFDTFF